MRFNRWHHDERRRNLGHKARICKSPQVAFALGSAVGGQGEETCIDSILAGASLLGTGIASAQYYSGSSDEGYWQRRGREYVAYPAIILDGAPNIRVVGVAVAPIAASSPGINAWLP